MVADYFVGGFGPGNGSFLNVFPGFLAGGDGAGEPFAGFDHFALRDIGSRRDEGLGLFLQGFEFVGRGAMRFHYTISLALVGWPSVRSCSQILRPPMILTRTMTMAMTSRI